MLNVNLICSVHFTENLAWKIWQNYRRYCK